MATVGAVLAVLLWLVVAGIALVGFMLLRAAGFAVIQRHGAVMIKFLVVWLLEWLAVDLLLGGIVGASYRGASWDSVAVSSGLVIAAAVCSLTARHIA